MKKIIIMILIVSFTYSQNDGNIFSQESNDFDTNSMQLNQNLDITSIENLTYTPVEVPIDPDSYILGPGDLLGVNIISTKNKTMPIRINPLGEIMIPSVGVLNVSYMSLNKAREKIRNYIISNAFKNAKVNVTLLDIRRFKIQILGAIQNPGYISVTPLDKVYDAILQSGGIHEFAHPEKTVQIRRGEDIIEIKLKNYLLGKDTSQNVLLNAQDIIFIPFSDEATLAGLTSDEFNNQQILVSGFVNRNGVSNSFKYYPGYTARDYIAMAGGTKEQGSSFRSGNTNRTIVYRSNGTKIKNAINEIVQPGDIIEVPPSILYQIVGGDGIIRTLTTVASIATSIYIIDSLSNK